MGVSTSRTFNLDSFVTEIGNDVNYERSLGNSRFLKAIKCKSRSGKIVVKVFTKSDPSVNLSKYIQRLKKEKSQLFGICNVYPFQTFVETDKAGYKIRQWIGNNLYDRISTRPFLAAIEKKWLGFQLLCALQDCHTCQVSHGDVKSENVLVTSSNWVYLTDFASVKPSHLPLDDPSEFSLYFDTSARRTCYLAPERFYDSNSEIANLYQLILEKGPDNVNTYGKLVVTEAMDVFSAGCVLAELFLEGTPLFTFSQLLRYRESKYDPNPMIDKIDDEMVKELIKSMISINPDDRLSFSRYLTEYREKVFPDNFYSFLYDYLARLNEPIQQPQNSYFPPSNTSATPFDGNYQLQIQSQVPNHVKYVPEERIERIWNDWSEINEQFDESCFHLKDNDELNNSDCVFPVKLSLPNTKPLYVILKDNIETTNEEDDTALLISTIICSNIRNCLKPSFKLKALELLLATSCYLKDETKLDRIIPYVLELLNDGSDLVRQATLRTTTQLLLIVGGITPANSTIFVEYLLPLIQPLANDSSILVRTMLAQCIAPLAETGLRFLDMAESMKSNNEFNVIEINDRVLLDGNQSYGNSYESSLHELQMFIEEIVITLLTDSNSMTKRALLQDIIPLCMFFGSNKSNDLLLTHINTYLNDRDWELRAAFFDSVVGIATCVGGKSVEEYILPLVIQSLADAEENVIVNVIDSIRKLAELGLFKKIHIWELIGMTLGFMIHPNIYIRKNTFAFISVAVLKLPETDIWCIIYPQLVSLLKFQIYKIDECLLQDAVLPPLKRDIFNIAQEWSLKVPKSPFWKTNSNSQLISFKDGMKSLKNSIYQSPSQYLPNKLNTQICDEDKPFIDKMTSNGFTKEDEVKLAYLRTHILMISKAQESRTNDQNVTKDLIENTITLSDLKVAPETVFIGTRNSNLVSGTLEANFKNRSNLSKQRSIESWSKQITLSQRSTPPTDYARPTVSRDTGIMDIRKRLVSQPIEMSKPVDVSRRESVNTLETMNSTSPRFPDTAHGSPTDSALSFEGSPTITYHQRPVRRNKLPSDGQKAAPAIGSSNANATGLLELPHKLLEEDNFQPSGISTPHSTSLFNPKSKIIQPYHHTYEGSDPAILKMLDHVCKKTLREPLYEFGQKVRPLMSIRRRKSMGINEDFNFRMVANFKEHTSSITSIVVSSDHLFFVTGSNDTTAKVWDSARLEKNVTSKSRQTIQRNASIKAMCMLQDYHCVAIAAKDGSVVVVRVDVSTGSTLPKYSPDVKIIREFEVSGSKIGEYITWIYHYNTDTSSNLIYTTSHSNIVILNLRTMKPVLELSAPIAHGPIISACIDNKRIWVVTGSLYGHFCLWDLRFGILVHEWCTNCEGSIQQVEMDPLESNEKYIIASIIPSFTNQTIIEVHDVESKKLIESYETQEIENFDNNNSSDHNQHLQTPSQAIEHILNGGDEIDKEFNLPLESETVKSFLIGPASKIVGGGGIWFDSLNYQQSHNSNLNSSGWVVEDNQFTNKKIKRRYLIVGTSESQIKIWHLNDGWNKSKVLLGNHRDTSYNKTRLKDGVNVYVEERNLSQRRTSRVNAINEQNERLLNNHNHSIEALGALELPFRALISGDKSGVFKVWRVD